VVPVGAQRNERTPKNVWVDVLQKLGVETLLSVGEFKVRPRGSDDVGNVTGIRQGHGR
jgi:hypothetical protein